MDLEEVREEIEEVDREIVRLIGERMDLAAEVNEVKAEKDLPVHDEEQVKNVLERATDQATEEGIDSHFVKEIFQIIIDECEEKQYELRGERSVL